MLNKNKIIPLSISKDYVSDWSVWCGVREFWQNSLDQDDPEITIGEEEGTLTITNGGGCMSVENMLMGGGTKQDGGSRGKFGEGSKLAWLVLLRNNKGITVRNGKDQWIPHFAVDDTFGVETLHVEILSDEFPHEEDDTVEINIDNLSHMELYEIKRNCIALQPDLDKFSTNGGDILLDDNMKGHIYVGGLFVCIDGQISKGYDFHPDRLTLDRDRSLARTWDIISITDSMLGELSQEDEYTDTVVSLIEADSNDTRCLQYSTRSVSDTVINRLHDNFVDKHGEDAILAETFEESQQLKKQGYKKVVFTGKDTLTKLVKRSVNYKAIDVKVKTITPDEYLEEFKNTWYDYMDSNMLEAYNVMQENVVDSL